MGYLRRAFHYLRRGVEIWLFTPAPCPSRMVTSMLVREEREVARPRPEKPERGKAKLRRRS